MLNIFYGCSGLTEVNYNATNCTDMGFFDGYPVFTGCSSLSNVNIGNNVQNIPSFAFCVCSGLTNITIPNFVTSIGSYAFADCNNLESVTIHNSVTSIGVGAFMNCNNLTKVKVEWPSPISIQSTFPNRENATLYVPKGSKTAYQSAAYWKDFKEIVEYEDESTISYELSIFSDRNGSATYSNNTISNETKKFIVEEGGSATLTFTPNSGYKVGSLKVNNIDVTSSINNNEYTINNINKDITIEVTFVDDTPVLDLSQYVHGYSTGGSIMQTNDLINSGSQLNWRFENKSDVSVTLKSMQLIDGKTGAEGNVMAVGVEVAGGSSVSYSTTIGVLGINVPVTCRFKYEYNGHEYSTDAVYKGNSGYTLTISSTGKGSVSYKGTTIREQTSSFDVSSLSSATVSFTPDNGYRIKTVKVNGTDVTSRLSNNQYTINMITQNTTVEVTYEEVPTYKLSITSSGSGSVNYSDNTIIGATRTYTINEGTSATLTFTPNSGYRIGSLKVNGVDLTSSIANNTYTISSITKNTTVEVTFEAIPPTTYTLSITSSGSGSVSYSGYTFSNATRSYTVNEGTSAALSFTPNSGYRVGSLKVNGVDLIASVSNNKYTISNISRNTTVEVTFEAIPPTTYTLSITSSGSGSVSYSGNTISSTTRSYTVNEGSSATLTFTPNSGYQIGSVKINGVAVTVSNNRYIVNGVVVTVSNYTISSIAKNTTVEVTFEAIPPTTHTLTIKSSGSGSVSCLGYTINGTEKKITVNEGTSATLTFTPNSGYQVGSVKVDGVAVTVSNNRYTISSITKDTTVEVTFEAIPPTTYTMTITSGSGGYVTYLGNIIVNETKSYNVNEGSSAALTFTPNSGYRIGSLIVNGVDLIASVSNNKYTVSNISRNTTVSVTFEAIPPTTYTLSITSSGGGSVSYSGNTISSTTRSYTVNEGSSATLTFTPNSGYRVGSLKVNNVDVTSSVSNNKYTISSISRNTTVSVTFEAIPPTTYTLSITSSGSGSVSYSGNTISNTTKSYTVNEGTSATLTFTPSSDYRIGSLKVNNVDVTSSVSNNKYTISSITKNTTVEVTFEQINMSLTFNGVNYRITSYDNGTVNVANGNYGQSLKVPASFYVDGKNWLVRGMDSDVITSNPQLAAVIWGPSVKFDASTYNPNFLLYVTSADYAPSTIKNVIVNGTANSITLKEATSGNDFYCPEAFTARSISYMHNYMMTTGIGESQGWETIALPFDVQTITHSTKGEIIPFAKWSSGNSRRPFWLYELTSSGWREASFINAYTPYIISMPNNDRYYDEARLNGNVTFSATNVRVEPTSVKTANYQGKTFIPNFEKRTVSGSKFALNVRNSWVQYTGNYTEGSQFVRSLRAIYPFEAYMSSENSTRSSFPIFEDMTTGIRGITELIDMKRIEGVYNLKGQKVKVEADGKLPAGIYIINGQKVIVK